MKVKQLKQKPDFQNMSLDNFLDNMDVDAGEEETESKPKGKLKSNGIEKAKKKMKAKNDGGGMKQKVKSAVEKAKPNAAVETAASNDGPHGVKKKNKKKKADETQNPPSGEENVKKSVLKDKKQNGNAVGKNIKQERSAAKSGKGNGQVYDPETSMKEVEQEHQEALSKLEKTDPELFAFLKKNDEKLLKFGEMDSDISDLSDSEDEAEGSDDEAVHKPTDKLEVASDESDFEADDQHSDDDGDEDEDDGDEEGEKDEKQAAGMPQKEAAPGTKVTFKLLRAWTADLTTMPVKYVYSIRNICKAFNSAIYTVTGEQNTIPPYRVEGSAMFNAIVQTCVLHLVPAVRSFLRLNEKRQFKDLKKDKNFTKVRACLKTYLVDLTNLIENVSSTHIMSVLLKHLHQFTWILIRYPHITKPILKRMIVIWSTSDEETIRVLAFLIILKITNAQSRYLSVVLKTMYLSYVKNSKFVSPNTLPNINFMRRSLAELFLLDFNVSYQHMFLYIRQLAIHLRNAVVLMKKESYEYIYNWQYINSLKLWGDILGAAYQHGGALEPLIYPFVSITIGVIKLIPSAQYFPLRFHCCRILSQLNAKTRIYIPVLPFLVEVLKSNSFNARHTKLSVRPVNLTCLLRVQPSNIQQNGYKDAVLDQIHELTLEFAANESASVAFPEMILPVFLGLRQFAKGCKIKSYSQKIKHLSDKLLENYEFIEKRRAKLDVPLHDVDRIKAWEELLRVEGTPLARYHATVAKDVEKVKRRLATDSQNIGDYNLPTLKKVERKAQQKQTGPVTLFPSDDEDEDDEKVGFGAKDEDDDSDGDASMDGSDEEMESEDDEDEEEELPTVGKKKAKDQSKQGNAKPSKQRKESSSKAEEEEDDEDEDFPLENGKDTDHVDILKDLNMNDWDD